MLEVTIFVIGHYNPVEVYGFVKTLASFIQHTLML